MLLKMKGYYQMNRNEFADNNFEDAGVRAVNIDEKLILSRFDKIQKKHAKKYNLKNHNNVHNSVIDASDTSEVIINDTTNNTNKTTNNSNNTNNDFVVDSINTNGISTSKKLFFKFNNSLKLQPVTESDNDITFMVSNRITPEENKFTSNTNVYDDEEEETPMIFFEKNNTVKHDAEQNINEDSDKNISNEGNDINSNETEDINPRLNGKELLSEVIDWIKHIGIAVIIGILLVMFVVQRNLVIGSSMEPNLYENDQLIVQKISKLYVGGIAYEDIVTINADNLLGHNGDKNIIKRVIGLPGDTIEIRNDGVYRNKVKLQEDYLHGINTSEREPQFSNVTLKENQYYVLGDNRNVSLDSRTFGPVDKSRIIGEVLIRFYPLNKFGRP